MSDTLRKKLKGVEDDLTQLRRERADKVKARDEAREKFANAPGYDTNSEEFKAAQEAVKAVGEIDDKIADVQSAQVGILKMLGSDDGSMPRSMESVLREKDAERVEEWNSKGVFESDAFKAIQRFAESNGARIGNHNFGEVAPREAIISKAITVGAGPRRGNFGGIQPPALQAIRLLDLIQTAGTNGNSVPYVQEDFTNAAAETAEGDLKPEAGLTLTDADAPVRTIAHWTVVPKQVLADVAALQGIIDQRLRYGVLRRLENQIVNGDGAGANLRGILNTTGIGTVARDAAGGEPAVEAIARAITAVYLADSEADAVVLHPNDFQGIRLMREGSGTGTYLYGGPGAAQPLTVWGVPAIVSKAVPEGTGLVGDFSMAAQLFVRSGVEVLASDSDSDNFRRNRVSVLAEMRAGFAVYRPAAFTSVTGI